MARKLIDLPEALTVNNTDQYLVQQGDTSKFITSGRKRLYELQEQYTAAGYPVAGNTIDGCTLTEAASWILHSDYTVWKYTGSLPFSATAGTVPSEPTYQVVHVKSASAISNANGGSVQDFIDAQYTTVAELATGKFQVGQYVRLTDRAMGLFLVQSGGTPNGYDIINAGNGNTAVLVNSNGVAFASHYGIVSGEDGTLALLAALNSGESDVVIGDDIVLISANIVIPDGVSLRGQSFSMGYNPSTGERTTGTVLRMVNNASILMGAFTSLSNLSIHNDSVIIPSANDNDFSGIAINLNGDRVTIDSVYTIGHSTSIYCNGTGGHNISKVIGDAINGIDLVNSYDINRVSNCHYIFLATYNASIRDDNSATLSNSRMRNGTAFKLSGANDWTKLTNCFEYSHTIGFRVDNPQQVTLIGCASDNLTDTSPFHAIIPNTVGLYISSDADLTDVIGIQIAGKEVAIQVNSSAGKFTRVSKVTARSCKLLLKILNGYVELVDVYYNGAYPDGAGGGAKSFNSIEFTGTPSVNISGVVTFKGTTNDYQLGLDVKFFGLLSTESTGRKLSDFANSTSANGTMIRNVDGTARAFITIPSPVVSGGVWTLPSGFISAPKVTMTINSFGGTFYTGASYVRAASATQVEYYFNSAIPSSVTLTLTADGFWK